MRHAEYWVKDIRENAPDNCILALAGNKSDMYEKSQVSLTELQTFSMSHKIDIYNECSAKTNTGVTDIF